MNSCRRNTSTSSKRGKCYKDGIRLCDGEVVHARHLLIHHTDRGSQYTADEYLALLATYDIQVSMSGKGDPYDNAMIESFFSTLRAELTDLHQFQTRRQARTALFDFIEVFYNRQRLHSSLGYCSPLVYETNFFS